MLIKRRLLKRLFECLEDKQFIAIRGPRQSGKTTILKQLYEELSKNHGVENVVYKTFEDPFELQAFENSPQDYIKLFIKNDKKQFILLDEVQYDKNAGKHLKLVYDTIENVKIILTGSSTLDIAQVSSYLVGRVHLFDLLTLNFDEYLSFADERLEKAFHEGNKTLLDILNNKKPEAAKTSMIEKLNSELAKFMVFGGYPAVCTSLSESEKIQLLKDIYITYLEKDIARQYNLEENSIRNLSITLALQDSSIVNYSEVSNHTGEYYKKIINMTNVLENTFILKTIRPFTGNLRNEIKKNPKVYFYDLGLRNQLAQNFNRVESRSDQERGALAENFAFIELQKYIDRDFLYFWRTKAGAEVDFIINKPNLLIPVEVKYSNFKKPEITRSMSSFIEAYKPKYAVILNKNLHHIEKKNNTTIAFIPLAFI